VGRAEDEVAGGARSADLPAVEERQRQHWRGNLRLTAFCLGVWALVTFAPAYWAQRLNRVEFLGWPLGFYMAAQGALIIYVILIGIYAWGMDRLDRRWGVGTPHEGRCP
jgi:putative solute:sodium symporter small subunit